MDVWAKKKHFHSSSLWSLSRQNVYWSSALETLPSSWQTLRGSSRCFRYWTSGEFVFYGTLESVLRTDRAMFLWRLFSVLRLPMRMFPSCSSEWHHPASFSWIVFKRPFDSVVQFALWSPESPWRGGAQTLISFYPRDRIKRGEVTCFKHSGRLIKELEVPIKTQRRCDSEWVRGSSAFTLIRVNLVGCVHSWWVHRFTHSSQLLHSPPPEDDAKSSFSSIIIIIIIQIITTPSTPFSSSELWCCAPMSLSVALVNNLAGGSPGQGLDIVMETLRCCWSPWSLQLFLYRCIF